MNRQQPLALAPPVGGADWSEQSLLDAGTRRALGSINLAFLDLAGELAEEGRLKQIAGLPPRAIDSLIDPEANLPVNYRAIQVVTKSGATVAGIRLNEDDFSIQLRDTQDNLRSFLKQDLKEIRRDRPSLMPKYGSILTRQELTDLVAYLSSLRGSP